MVWVEACSPALSVWMYALCNQVSIVIALWKEGVVSGGICGGGIGVVGRQRLLDLRSFARGGFLVTAVEEAHVGFGEERRGEERCLLTRAPAGKEVYCEMSVCAVSVDERPHASV